MVRSSLVERRPTLDVEQSRDMERQVSNIKIKKPLSQGAPSLGLHQKKLSVCGECFELEHAGSSEARIYSTVKMIHTSGYLYKH